jgi:hypothetical protein
MWNQIRLPQYSEVRDGQINYIAAGYSNQFGAETHLLAVLCTSSTSNPYHALVAVRSNLRRLLILEPGITQMDY